MKEIRFHGLGGQGAVTAANILASAAFLDGKYSQAFPSFGVERRGAPVFAFTRIDEKPVRIRSQIYEPDYVVVQDTTLLDIMDVTEGLKENGIVIVNTQKTSKELGIKKGKVYTIDATGVALEKLGVPIVNTAMLGAIAKATGIVTLDSVKKALEDYFKDELLEKNRQAVEEAYRRVVL